MARRLSGLRPDPSPSAPANPSDHPVDRLRNQPGLIKLDVVPALGGDHVLGARHELRQHVLRILKCAVQRLDRQVGRETERVREVREWERTTSGIGRSGVSACAWRISAALAPRARSSTAGYQPRRGSGRAPRPRTASGVSRSLARRRHSPRSGRRSRPARRPPWDRSSHTGARTCRRRSGRPGHRGRDVGGPQQGVEVGDDVARGAGHRDRVAAAERLDAR